MADRGRGLLDSEEDIAEYLRRMTTPAEPNNFEYKHTLSPEIQALISAAIQPSFRDPKSGETVPQVISPGAGLSLGPLSLTGGFDISQATNPETGNRYTQALPTVGAGLKVPLLSGEAELTAKYTPEQLKLFEAFWKKKILNDTGEIGLYGNYGQTPGDTPPKWGVGIRGRIPL